MSDETKKNDAQGLRPEECKFHARNGMRLDISLSNKSIYHYFGTEP